MNDYTYQKLLEELQALTPEQLEQTVTVRDIQHDEMFAANYSSVSGANEDRLDVGHFYINFWS